MTNKPVARIELIIASLTLLGVIITSWVNINTRITALEIQQKGNSEFQLEMRTYFKELTDGQTKILVALENKKDRE